MERLGEKQQRILEETAKDHIFSAVIRVTQRSDTTDFTMQQIANEAGMATGSLYRYFRDKDRLLTYVVERLVDMHRKRQDAIGNGPGPVLERLEQLATSAFQFTSDYVLLFRIFDHRGLRNRFEEEDENHFATEISQIRDIMAEGIAQGVLRRMDPLLMARMFFASAISFFFVKPIFNEYSAEQLGQEVVRLFKA